MIGIVIVAHSKKLADGVKEIIEQMVPSEILIAAAGGAADHIGTDAVLIRSKIDEVYSEDGVLVLVDFGSSIISAKAAIALLPAEKRTKTFIADAPLVEGSFMAAVDASVGKSLEEVRRAAESSRDLRKK